MTKRLIALCAALALLIPAAATAATPRASLTDIENDVMCQTCHEPLASSQSPEANRERAFIRGLVNQGMTKSQILNALVANYGQGVLGKPPASGFNLTVYVLPPALLLGGIAILAFTLPKWRRRARSAPPLAAAAPLLSADARRLDEDLARFDRG